MQIKKSIFKLHNVIYENDRSFMNQVDNSNKELKKDLSMEGEKTAEFS